MGEVPSVWLLTSYYGAGSHIDGGMVNPDPKDWPVVRRAKCGVRIRHWFREAISESTWRDDFVARGLACPRCNREVSGK